MSMKKISLIIAVILLVASANIAMAGHRGKGGGMGPWAGMNDPALSNLNLTTEQEEKIRALGESHQKELAPLRMELFKKHTELKLLWMQTNLDANKIKAKQKEIHELRGKLQEKYTDSRLDFFNILTPEQRTQFILQRHGRGHGFRGPRAGLHGPGHGKGPGIGPGMGLNPPR
jgi:Spy/CpxP family protein refolding chaperone